MTADDAGVNVRERLARTLYGTWLPENLWPHLSTESREKYYEAADAVIAGGFGSMAEAWREGYDIGTLDHSFEVRGSCGDPDAHEFPHANPYRTTDTNGAGE